MPVDIILIVLFIVTGIVVSLDVTGLTLSKSRYFHDHPKELFVWSLSNAAWHAGLLLVYIAVISGALNLFPRLVLKLPELLRALFVQFNFDLDYITYITVVARSLFAHAPVLLGIAALCILWSTYSEKIVSVPSTGSIAGLSPLARITFNLVDLVFRVLPKSKLKEGELVRLIYWQAQAALVAVDMLALAALLKSMQVLNAWNTSFLVCAIVFVTVGTLAAIAGVYGRTAYARMQASPDSDALRQSRVWLLVTIRLAEPFLIFYFAFQLVAFLIWGKQIHSVTFFLASGLLVAALVSKHSLVSVVEKTLTEPPNSQVPLENLRSISDVLVSIRTDLTTVARWIAYSILAIVAFSVFLYLKALLGLGSKNPSSISLESEISLFLGFLKALSAFLIVWNVRPFHHLEDAMAEYLESVVKHAHAYLFVIAALFIAAVFPIHEELLNGLNAMRGGTSNPSLELFGIGENHKHVLQLSLWLVYFLLLSGACIAIRERWSIEIADADSQDRKTKNKLWRELFFGFFVVAAALLALIGWLQLWILPTN